MIVDVQISVNFYQFLNFQTMKQLKPKSVYHHVLTLAVSGQSEASLGSQKRHWVVKAVIGQSMPSLRSHNYRFIVRAVVL